MYVGILVDVIFMFILVYDDFIVNKLFNLLLKYGEINVICDFEVCVVIIDNWMNVKF